MKVSTLRDMLEGYDDDADVRIAYQPSWPLAAEIANVLSLEDINLSDEQLAEQHWGDDTQAVWLVAADGRVYPDPYAPTAVFQL